MNTLNIILATISIMMLIEGFIISVFPNTIIRAIKKFKSRKNVVKAGLIEIILALLILLIIAL